MPPSRFPSHRCSPQTPADQLSVTVEATSKTSPRQLRRPAGRDRPILDGTDNFETRYLLNDYAVRENRAWIYTAAVGSYGVTMNILPGETSCLACVFPQSPTGATETCDTGGISTPPSTHRLRLVTEQ